MKHYTWNGSQANGVNTKPVDGYTDVGSGDFVELTPNANNFALARPIPDSTKHASSAFRANNSNNSFARINERETGGDAEPGEGVVLNEKIATLMPKVLERFK